MKKFIILTLVCLFAIPSFAEVLNFRTTKFYYAEQNQSFDSGKASDMLVQIDLDQNNIYINSPHPQTYKLKFYVSNGYDNDSNYISELQAVDQDGDRCIIKLIMFKSGKNQLHILFNDCRWSYDIQRIN